MHRANHEKSRIYEHLKNGIFFLNLKCTLLVYFKCEFLEIMFLKNALIECVNIKNINLYWILFISIYFYYYKFNLYFNSYDSIYYHYLFNRYLVDNRGMYIYDILYDSYAK